MQIFITGWWLCPELYLRRPFQHHGSSRLDALLEARAKQGVQVPSLLLYFYDFHQKLSRIWYMKGRRAWNYEATFATCSVIYLLLHMLTANKAIQEREQENSRTYAKWTFEKYLCIFTTCRSPSFLAFYMLRVMIHDTFEVWNHRIVVDLLWRTGQLNFTKF